MTSGEARSFDSSIAGLKHLVFNLYPTSAVAGLWPLVTTALLALVTSRVALLAAVLATQTHW
jgi:alkanesulfonate monooxygenase SsuD/methylene tetrahydromethanopterin reductase-like flavin-dependent oxidoreductase (luciferase family)